MFALCVTRVGANPAPNRPNFLVRLSQHSNIDMASARSQFRSRSRTLEAPAESWDDDVEAACEFIEKFDHFAATISPNLIVNVDETPAYVKNAPSHANHSRRLRNITSSSLASSPTEQVFSEKFPTQNSLDSTKLNESMSTSRASALVIV